MSERVNTVVVGASAAGLSTAYCLLREGVEHVLLEKEECVASVWRNHYERLHLHTSKRLSAALIKNGDIEVRPSVERFTESGVVFTDGREEEFAAVVLGTGYRPAVSDFLAEAAQVCSKDGVPTKSGDEVLPGLYFCGFHVSPTGMLREIAIEAKRIARSVASV